MKAPRFKEGDVVRNSWGDVRAIFAVADDGYYYLETSRHEDDGFFYNPTKAFVSHNAIDQKYTKMGVVDDLVKLKSDLPEIIAMFADAFAFAHSKLHAIRIMKE